MLNIFEALHLNLSIERKVGEVEWRREKMNILDLFWHVRFPHLF